MLTTVGGILTPGCDGSKPPLEKLMEGEWAKAGSQDLTGTTDQLEPLMEFTEQLKELLFTGSDRKAVLRVVGQVILSLVRRSGRWLHFLLQGSGEDARNIVSDLLEILRMATQSTGHRPAYR